ncbi:MAG TPA: hypothetical protein VD927_05765 [Chryseosolibacter sp.]|nr:hypothetical protein [Chryseosolibacter sp.]
MMNGAFAVACLILVTSVPYKPASEFTVKLDYNFKARPARDNATVKFDETNSSSTNTGILPYLVINITIDSLNHGETRVKISSNQDSNVLMKKVRPGSVVSVDLGFTDDAKDGVTANEFTVFFLDAKKNEVNKIVIKVDEEGNFFINEEKRGKF